MIGFEHPELWLLAAPALWAAWTWRSGHRGGLVLRGLLLLAVVAAAAGPFAHQGQRGRDLIVVLDRSRSMPVEGDRDGLELALLAEGVARPGDRLGLVTFGADVRVDRPARTGPVGELGRAPNPDGSDLAGAVETALELIPRGRPGALVVISDGESESGDLDGVAHHAFARGIPIHVRPTPRPLGDDVAVESVELPDEVAVGEPFQFVAWVHSDTRTEATVTLERGGVELRSDQRLLEPGLNRVVFRDRLSTAGIASYSVGVRAKGDPAPENDRAVTGVRVRGERGVLLLCDTGGPTPLSQALSSVGIPVVAAAPEQLRIDPTSLASFRAVVIENVDAGRIGFDGLDALADFVQHRGGGLLLTGGLASFGRGGYHNSPLDEVLPVTLEMRSEHRRIGVALGMALDRSGSMAMGAAPGLTKMDLANSGAAAAIKLLSPMDAVTVYAVDTGPHQVVGLTPVEDVAALAGKIRRIESMGGGIYTKTAITAVARELLDAPQLNRHIILFADANDAEEQGGCVNLVADLARAGTTCSVIALGSKSDQHAGFLEAVARAGGGEAYFTTKAKDLPRLFSQDTLTAARSGFIEVPTAVQNLPGLLGMGDLPGDALPPISGYNLTYLRSDATAGAVTTDDYRAPIIAYGWYGLGRSAAYTGQVGGEFGAPIVAWPEFQALFSSIVRWLVGLGEPEGLFADVERRGGEALVSVEVDAESALEPELARLEANLRLPSGAQRTVTLERSGATRFEARVPLTEAGITVGTVDVGGGRALALPVIGLPYSPEFERGADPNAGRRRMRQLADVSGGQVEPNASELFDGDRAGTGRRPLRWAFLLAAVLLALVEIAFRRLDLWSLLRRPRWLRLESIRRPRALRRAKAPVATAPDSTGTVATAPAQAGATPGPSEGSDGSDAAPSSPPPADGNAEPAEPGRDLGSALRKARGSAGRRLKR